MAMGHKRDSPGKLRKLTKATPGVYSPGAGRTDCPALPGARGGLGRAASRAPDSGRGGGNRGSPHLFPSGSPGTRPVAPEGCGQVRDPQLVALPERWQLPGERAPAASLVRWDGAPRPAGLLGLRGSGEKRGPRAEPRRAASRRGGRRFLRRAPCSHRSPTWLL
ncbi:collagen alpha-1(XXIII) chain-like [Corvus hawaiiensis]|uniref:collagen alpha-1(XXIII) chain-like n=1 Tax=Corvus hawaiiensis TaxID=134902 RepID=UPI0020193997|nr:collagen alpha-1(XXIII) chain-like [Corvus hawaiiensis]